MVNVRLQTDQLPWVALCNHIVQVTTVKGHDSNGKPVLDNTTTRQYRCYIQDNERTSWNDESAVDGMPYVAYVLSIPIGGTDAVPIRKNDQMTIVVPTYLAPSTPRRIGVIKSYPDQYGDLHNMAITFE